MCSLLRKARGAVHLMIAFLLILPGCQSKSPDEDQAVNQHPSTPRLAKREVDLSSLRSTANAACECALRAGKLDNAGCWETFNQTWKRLEDRNYPPGSSRPTASGMACAPVSSRQRCIELTDGTLCVETSYELVGTEHFVCENEDAVALEALVNERKTGDENSSNLETVYSDFLAGIRSKRASVGCIG